MHGRELGVEVEGNKQLPIRQEYCYSSMTLRSEAIFIFVFLIVDIKKGKWKRQ